MASDPEVERHLEKLEKRGYTEATVTFENLKSSGARHHRVKWKRLAEPWEAWHFHNRLDAAWFRPPFEYQGKELFPVEEKAIDKKTGKVKLKWSVWTNSDDLGTLQKELYSVMRAEYQFIEKEHLKKIASKYYSEVGPGSIPTENCGVDNFFTNGNRYVVCESKFTGNEGKFDTWQDQGSPDSNYANTKGEERVWKYLRKYNGLKPMTWKWIHDRAARAVDDPPVKLQKRTPEQNERVCDDVAEMLFAVQDEEAERWVNIYAAERVPIYPGRYKFICGERTTQSKNLLHLKWDFTIDEDAEFIELDQRYDDWWDEENKKKKKKK